MKIRVTNKAIKDAYKNIILVRNCELEILDYLDPDYYNYGIEGWKYDAYIVSTDTITVTGYQPFGNFRPTAVEIENCNKQCKEVKQAYDKHLDYQRFESDLKQILITFAAGVTTTISPF